MTPLMTHYETELWSGCSLRFLNVILSGRAKESKKLTVRDKILSFNFGLNGGG
jgi:hypothetical protein